MSCFSPVTIKNNSRSFDVGVSPLKREVGCGHCLSCSALKQQDWFVRLAYEYKKCSGNVYFVTLTYNDDEIPYYKSNGYDTSILRNALHRLSIADSDVLKRVKFFESEFCGVGFYEPFSHVHFERKHLQRFFKSLRQILNEKKVLLYEEAPLKFFCGCEFGEDYHRCHYHILIFSPKKIDEIKFLDYCQLAWSHRVLRKDLPNFVADLVAKHNDVSDSFSFPRGVSRLSSHPCWNDWIIYNRQGRLYIRHIFGFAQYSKKGALIQSFGGLKYVCKYVSKKDDYMCNEKWNILGHYLHCFPRCLDEYKNTYPDMVRIVSILRSYFPFVHTSNYLGISILHEFDLLDKEQVAELVVNGGLKIDGEQKSYRVPQYIINRIMYAGEPFDKSLRVLTDVGCEILKERINSSVQFYARSLEQVERVYSRYLTDSERSSLALKYPHIPLVGSSLLHLSPDYGAIAVYKYLFQYVECPKDFPKDVDLQTVLDTFLGEFLYRQIHRVYDVNCPPSLLPVSDFTNRLKRVWNKEKCFSLFDDYIACYDEIKRIVLGREFKTKHDEYVYNSKLRNQINSMIYNSTRYGATFSVGFVQDISSEAVSFHGNDI